MFFVVGLSLLMIHTAIATTPIPPTIPLSAVFPTPSLVGIPPADFSCWTSHVSYSLHSSSIYYADENSKLKFTYTDSTFTYYGDYTVTRPPAETTLCDGAPRVTGSATPTGSATLTTQTIKTTWTSTWIPSVPTCTVDSYDSICRKMYWAMTSITSRLNTQSSPSPTIPTYLMTPPCRTPDTWPNPAAPLSCSLVVSTYKVLYWPKTVKGDFCGNKTTIEPTPTISGKPNTARYGSLTATSPTIYHILEDVQMQTFAGRVNANRGMTWLPIDKHAVPPPPMTIAQNPVQTPISSAIISCNLGRQCYTTLKPFSLEHLKTVPASDYYSLVGGSDIIYQGYYSPLYTLPTGIPTTANGWGVCQIMFTGPVRPTYVDLQPTA